MGFVTAKSVYKLLFFKGEILEKREDFLFIYSFWHWIQNQSFKGLYPLSIGSKITQIAEEGLPNWSFNTKKFPETNMIDFIGRFILK